MKNMHINKCKVVSKASVQYGKRSKNYFHFHWSRRSYLFDTWGRGLRWCHKESVHVNRPRETVPHSRDEVCFCSQKANRQSPFRKDKGTKLLNRLTWAQHLTYSTQCLLSSQWKVLNTESSDHCSAAVACNAHNKKTSNEMFVKDQLHPTLNKCLISHSGLEQWLCYFL